MTKKRQTPKTPRQHVSHTNLLQCTNCHQWRKRENMALSDQRLICHDCFEKTAEKVTPV